MKLLKIKLRNTELIYNLTVTSEGWFKDSIRCVLILTLTSYEIKMDKKNDDAFRVFKTE